MELRTFGRTGLQVSALGLGGAAMAEARLTPDEARNLLDVALDSGLTMVDTAECYQWQDGPPSEDLLGHALAGRRDRVVLCTKCGHGSGLPQEDWTPELITASIDRSLQRLRTDRVDVIHLHTCDEATLRQGDAIAALLAARDAGKTRFVGYSGDGSAMVYAIGLGIFDTLITSVSVADQEAVDLIMPLAMERGMGVIAKRPVANGAWTYGYTPPTSSYHYPYWERLRELKYPFLGTPEAFDTAVRFTLSVPGMHTAIVGCADVEMWRANAATVAKGPLPEAEYGAIRERWAEVAGPDWGGKD
jgi:aryl-alcohol dehydrogenase-like predicted oxidoreductase